MTKHIKIPEDELEFQFSRSSGSGGQNVNKVNTRVTLRWNVKKSKAVSSEIVDRFISTWGSRINSEGYLILDCEKFRSQHRNREEAVKKLRAMIGQVATKPKTRKKTKPSKNSKERRLKEKKQHAEKKSARKPVSW